MIDWLNRFSKDIGRNDKEKELQRTIRDLKSINEIVMDKIADVKKETARLRDSFNVLYFEVKNLEKSYYNTQDTEVGARHIKGHPGPELSEECIDAIRLSNLEDTIKEKAIACSEQRNVVKGLALINVSNMAYDERCECSADYELAEAKLFKLRNELETLKQEYANDHKN